MFRKSTLLAVAFTFVAVGSSATPSVALPFGHIPDALQHPSTGSQNGGGLGGIISKIGPATGASSTGHAIWGVKIPQVTQAPTKFPNAGPKILQVPSQTSIPGALGQKVGGIDKLKLPPPGPLLPGGGSTPPTTGGGSTPPTTGSTPKPGDHDHPWGGPVVIVAPSESPVVVPSTTIVDQPATVVAPRFTSTRSTAIGRTVTSEPCNCLTKQYLVDGSVLFQDICTKEAAIANQAVQNAQVPAPRAQ